jgi:hypothetical protein
MGQAGAHIQRQRVILAAMCFIGDDNDIGSFR